MSGLNEFIANVKQGMARANHFTVELLLPEKLIKLSPIREKLPVIQMFCDQTQIPGVSFGTSQVRSYGEFKEVPYEKLWEPITMNFYVDKELYVKDLFDKWIDLVQDPYSRSFSYPNDYVSSAMNIITEDIESKARYKTTLYRCYPKSIAPIQLDYSSKDVMKLQVTFAYQYAINGQSLQQGDSNGTAEPIARQLPNYNYGYPADTVIPENYFTDFNAFQEQFYDFSLDGVRTIDSVENIGEFTGFGGIFNNA